MTVLLEEQLIEKSRKGDVNAFEELIHSYQQRIYSLAYRMTGNHEDAADISQEVIIRIYRSLGSFRGDAAFSTWVNRITVNACHDAFARKNRRNEVSLDEALVTDDGMLYREIADYSAIPENGYIEAESEQYLQNLILSLPPEHRMVLVLREINGLSYQEIESQLGLSMGTVKSRISRARAALRRKILADSEQYPQIACLIKQRGDAI